jgi:protein-S-isoprenylcysteine O-methyltransferase Ste14
MDRRALTLDVLERAFVTCLYGALVYRIVVSLRLHPDAVGNLLELPSEGMVLAFVLFRRTTENVSRRWVDWALAIAATCAPMLVRPDPHPLGPPVLGGVLLVLGLLVQVHAKVVLGRSFGCVPANRGLKRAGPYRFVRHPMYAGYMLSHLGFTLLNPSLWNVAMYLVCDVIQIPRLLAEERLLGEDPGYARYQAEVRFRLVPGLF